MKDLKEKLELRFGSKIVNMQLHLLIQGLMTLRLKY